MKAHDSVSSQNRLRFKSKNVEVKYDNEKCYLLIKGPVLEKEIVVPLSGEKIPSSGIFLGEHLPKRNLAINRVLEIGAGKYAPASFCALGIYAGAKIDLVEINHEDASYLRDIIKENCLEDRLILYEGNLFEPIKNLKYGLIFSNIAQMPLSPGVVASMHDHGGVDGWKFLSQIINLAPAFLNCGGYLSLFIFDFLGIKERNSESIPSLFERLDMCGFKVTETVFYMRKIRFEGETYRALDHIKKIYPDAKFYDEKGGMLDPSEYSREQIPLFLKATVVTSRFRGI